MSGLSDKEFIISGYKISPQLNQIESASGTITVEPLAMSVLIYLAENKDKTISREELLKNLWQGKHVTDNAINRIIANIRKALGDNVNTPQFIRTVPKHGYVFVADISFSRDRKIPYFLIATLLITISFIIFYSIESENLKHKNLSVSELKQFTSLPGVEENQISLPAEQGVLFTSQRSSRYNNRITLKLSGEVHSHYLTNKDFYYDDLSISQDGQRLAYTRYSRTDCHILTAKISIEQKQLSQPQIVASCEMTGDKFINWDINSNALYFTQYNQDIRTGKIMRLNLDDYSVAPLFKELPSNIDDYSLISLPLEDKFVFLRTQDKKQKIIQFSSKTLDEKVLFSANDMGIYHLFWLSKDNRILVRHSKGTSVLSLDNLTLSDINLPSEVTSSRHWSVTSKGEIVFQKTESKRSLYEQHNPVRTNKEFHRPISPSSRSEYIGSYSPSSNSILFRSNRESDHPRLWLEKNGELRLILIDDYGYKYHSVWSPTRDQLLYVNKDSGISSFDFSTSITNKLSLPIKDIGRTAWSKNRNLVYFSQYEQDESNIYQIQIDTKKMTQLTFNGGSYMQESSDGSYIYYNKRKEPGLFKLDKSTKKHELLWPEFPAGNYTWQLFNDSEIYFNRNESGQVGIFYFNLSTKISEEIISDDNIYHFNIANDQSKIIYTRYDREESDLYKAALN